MPSLTPIPVGTLILTPAAHGSSVTSLTAEHIIIHPDGTNAIESTNDTAYNLGLGGGVHYTYAADTTVFWVDRYGHINAGKNLLVAPHPRSNFNQTVADFLYDQVHQRVCCRSFVMSQIDDPADITGFRFGPAGGFPYAIPGNGDGTYLDLCGIDSNVAVSQFRAQPGAVPYGGDLTTTGSIAEATPATISLATTERPRYLTEQESTVDLSCGMRIDFGTTGNGYNGRAGNAQLCLQSSGNLVVGRSAFNAGDNGAQLQVRADRGENETFQFARSGTLTAGTFNVAFYGVPPASPAFAITATTTTNLNFNATAADFEAAFEGLANIGAASNLTGTLGVTNGITSVTGSGTAFTTELRVDDVITIVGVNYTISTITSDTALTLTAVYAGATAGGLTVVRRNVAGSGGPINSATVTIKFCGAVRNTHFVRPLINSSLTGGTVTCGYGTYGFASGGDNILARFQHGGRAGSVPSASYYQWRNPAGTVVQELDKDGLLTVANMAFSTQTISTSATLVNKSARVVIADCTSVPITATLPASPTEGTAFIFIDGGNNWTANNLTIARNGKTIDGVAANKTMNTSNTNATLLYADGGWWTV